MIWRKELTLDAPSIAAASYTTGGIPFRPARKKNIQYPTPIQDARAMMDGNASVGLLRKPCAGKPSATRMPLTRPGLRIQHQLPDNRGYRQRDGNRNEKDAAEEGQCPAV